MAQQQREGVEALVNDNPFARRIGTYKDKMPLGSTLDKNFQLGAGDGAAILAELNKSPIKVNGKAIDVPIHILEAAISDTQRDYVPNWMGGGIASRVKSRVETLMKNPDTLLEYQNADVLKANIRRPAQDAQPGATTSLLSNAALGKPPVVSKSGLEFSDPKRLNITSSEGVMAPATLPKGKQTVQATDGDTISVTGENGVKMSFRLNGVDAQETAKKMGRDGQKYSESARQFLQEALTKGQVEFQISSNKPDAYGRHVAEIFVDGQNLNDLLLKNGMASTMSIGEGPAAKKRREQIQVDAIKQQFGMHRDMGTNDGLPGSIYRSLGNVY
jgi:endonuclease YncB( thermonuclease family)